MRLFVAIDPPDPLRDALHRHVSALPGRLRIPPREQLHLTLRFLGDVDEERVPALVSALAEAAPGPAIALRIAGGGAFPSPARARTLWAGLQGDVDRLGALADRIERAIATLGLPPADHPFRPHLTLARAKGRIPRAAVDAILALPDLGEWSPAEIALVKSTLGERAVHERVAAFALEGAMGRRV